MSPPVGQLGVIPSWHKGGSAISAGSETVCDCVMDGLITLRFTNFTLEVGIS